MTAVRDLPSSVRTREQRRVVARCLRQIIKEGPRWTAQGICGNLTYLLILSGSDAYGYDVVRDLSRSWAHYSGNPGLPIVEPCYWDEGKWIGKRGLARQQLMQHMLNELKEMGL